MGNEIKNMGNIRHWAEGRKEIQQIRETAQGDKRTGKECMEKNKTEEILYTMERQQEKKKPYIT